jgi:hypothetical protein
MRAKLNSYFNTSCFTTPPIIGQDGIGTGFGNSGTGIVDGPAQTNVDLALSKHSRPLGQVLIATFNFVRNDTTR